MPSDFVCFLLCNANLYLCLYYFVLYTTGRDKECDLVVHTLR